MVSTLFLLSFCFFTFEFFLCFFAFMPSICLLKRQFIIIRHFSQFQNAVVLFDEIIILEMSFMFSVSDFSSSFAGHNSLRHKQNRNKHQRLNSHYLRKLFPDFIVSQTSNLRIRYFFFLIDF